ncbi:MAG: S4 domain-containing protein, partial [Chloroflexota bacterium]
MREPTAGDLGQGLAGSQERDDFADEPLDPEDGDGGEAIELRPEGGDRNARLDVFVAAALPDHSRGFVQKLIEDGHVLVDGLQRKPKFRMTPGQVVMVTIPEPEPEEIVPEPIPLEI